MQVSIILIRKQTTRVWKSSAMKQLSKCFKLLCRCYWMTDIIQISKMEMENKKQQRLRWSGWYQNNQRSEKLVMIGLVFWFSWHLLTSVRPVESQDRGTVWTAVSNQSVRTRGCRVSLCPPSSCPPDMLLSSPTHSVRLPAFSLRSKAKLVRSPLVVQISENRATEQEGHQLGKWTSTCFPTWIAET